MIKMLNTTSTAHPDQQVPTGVELRQKILDLAGSLRPPPHPGLRPGDKFWLDGKEFTFIRWEFVGNMTFMPADIATEATQNPEPKF